MNKNIRPGNRLKKCPNIEKNGIFQNGRRVHTSNLIFMISLFLDQLEIYFGGQIAGDGLHVLGVYVFIYAIYIPQTDLMDMGRNKC